MKVLIGCEFSQIVAKAFRDRGHKAYSCDFLPTEGNPEWHIQCDVLDILDKGWDLGIFHPSCRYLTNSGVRWLYEEEGRWQKMIEGAQFFKTLLNCKIPRIAVENPIQHKYALEIIGRKYDQIIQPYQFGHGETKATCLWLKGLPKLRPTKIVDGRIHRIHNEPPSEDRWKNRSRTYKGIAEAMATQWTNINTIKTIGNTQVI